MRCLVVAVASLFLFDSGAFAQNAPKDPVTFPTVDQVDLKGNFYPGQGENAGRKSPCVIMLHRWGSDISKGDWDTLAKDLQSKGYSVLSFDFRGHGKSKELRDKKEFWDTDKYPYNKGAGGTREANRIDVAKFAKGYYPWLINDIAAARKFLDEKNDAGECNSGKIFIIAERDMATLALLWAGTEHGRYGVAPTLQNPRPSHIAGSDISGLVLLSPDRRPQALTMPYDLGTPAARKAWHVKEALVGEPLTDKQSMCFIYGANDPSSAQSITYFYKTLFGADKVDKKDQIKYLVPIKDTKLAGVDLLGKKGLGTETSIVEYLEAVRKRGIGNNWVEREVNKMPTAPVPLDQLGFPFVK